MILIVDDIPENLFSLKSVLEHNNFKVDTASSGEEALRKILKTNYILILLDVQMPGMDGFEVAELISGNSKAKDSAIIFLSANHTDSENVLRGYSVGAVDYITKPVDLTLLLTRVKTLYEIVQTRIELKEQQQRIENLYESERKLAHSLSRERKKLLLTQRLAKMASWEYYIESEQLKCSPEVYKILKLDPKTEINLNRFLNGLSKDDLEKFQTVSNHFRNKSTKFEFSHYFQLADGSSIFLQHYGKLELKNGAPFRIIGALQDKTEEKENEQEFLKLYERYKIVNKATNDIICDWDILKNTLDFNNNITSVLGYPKEVFVRPETWWEEIVHPADLHVVKRQFETTIFKGLSNWNTECRLRCNDGSYKEVFAQSYCLYNSKGQLTRMVTATKDLSSLRSVENQLEQTELKLRQTIESINEGFFTCNRTWEITYWNNKCEEILNLRKEETLGKVLWDLFPPRNDTKFYDQYCHCLNSKRSVFFEEYYPPLEKWFRVNVHPSEEGVAVYFEDITKELIKDLELNKAIEKAELIKAASHDVIWEADVNSDLINFNRNLFLQYGYKQDVVTDRTWFKQRLHPDDCDRVLQSLKESLENNHNFWEQEYRFLDAYGMYHYVHGKAHIVKNEDNKPIHMTGSITNLQNLKEKEFKLEEIAFSNSHLLRKPLANILGLLDLLQGQAEQVEVIDMIKKSGQELDEIIKQIAKTTY